MPGQIPAYVFTLICEDIRTEEGSKLSLLGTYSENIFFKDHPMRMRSLAFYNRFSGGKGTFLLTVKLKSFSGELAKGVEIKDASFPKSKDSELTNIVTVIGNVEFKEEGLHQYEMYFDDIPDPVVRVPFGVYMKREAFGAG